MIRLPTYGLAVPNPDHPDDVLISHVALAALKAREALVTRCGPGRLGPMPLASVAIDAARRFVADMGPIEGVDSLRVDLLAAAILEVLMLDPVTLSHLAAQGYATPPGFLSYGQTRQRRGGATR